MSTPADSPPSLAWSQNHAITFLPSLMPRHVGSSTAESTSSSSAASLRDANAELFQRRQIWQMTLGDFTNVLKLPTVEFFSHALFSKSFTRSLTTILTQLPSIWAELHPTVMTGGRWATPWNQREKDGAEGENEEEEKKSNGDDGMFVMSEESQEDGRLLRGIMKRVLLVYVRLCSIDSSSPLLAGSSIPPWLTPTFFTTSFSTSVLFSSPSLLDLVVFYSTVDATAHRPLVKFVLDTIYARLPYAFTVGMTQSFNTLIQSLHTVIRQLHEPYASGSGNKKPRFVRDELPTLVRQLTNLVWTLYAMAEVRPELLRLLVQGVNGASSSSSKSSSSSSSSSTPPFIALLTTLYTVTPLMLLQELGIKYAQVSASPEVMALRRGCIMFVRLIFNKLVLKAMGVRKSNGRWIHRTKSSPSAGADKKLSATSSTTSSTLPPPLSQSAAADVFYACVKLMYDTVHDHAATKDGLCYLPLSMKNLISYNTGSTQNALLKRYNEYYELDTLCFFLREQALSTDSTPTPGRHIGKARVEELLTLLQQIDPPLIKRRIGWPLEQPKSASSSSSSSFDSFEDERKGPSSLGPSLKKQSSAAKKNGVDMTLAISSVHDFFPHLSTDFISACLTEYNCDVEQTTDAILNERLPSYLQDVKDKSKFRSGDQQDRFKLKSPSSSSGLVPMSRQSSTGSGLLDAPVDDEDALIDRIGSTADEDDDPDGFEAFLKRTGRVAKQSQANSKVSPGAALLLNSFDKADAAMLAKQIHASISQYDDEYDDAYDDFESFAIDDTPLDQEERAVKSIYDRRLEDGAGGEASDEPDAGNYQPTGKYSTARGGMRGGRGGANNLSSRGGRSNNNNPSSTGRAPNWDTVTVPSNFMPDSNPSKDIREQWRRDEERKELYVATMKAQRAQTIAPSKRTKDEANDYEHGIKHGLIKVIVPGGGGGGQKDGHKEQGGKQHQQQHPHQQSNKQQQAQSQSRRSDDSSSSHSTRGGFSARGGGRMSTRGGVAVNNERNATSSSSTSSSSASSFTTGAPSSQSHTQSQSRPQSSSKSDHVPSRWDEDSDSDDGGRHTSRSDSQQSGDDPSQRKRKEKNKSRVANHDRKAGALKKQGGMF